MHFKAKMHQIRFRLGLCLRTCREAYSEPQTLLVDLKGPTFKGKGEKKERGEEEEEERRTEYEGEVECGSSIFSSNVALIRGYLGL